MTLVNIGDTEYILGTSPTLGVMQRIDGRCLQNLHAFAKAFYKRWGERLVITEGARSRPRQTFLWNNWINKVPGAQLAARPFTSRHDEVNNPNAIDFGNGIGTSASARSVWAHANGGQFGISWTGALFVPREYWHGELSFTTTAMSNATPLVDTPTPEEGDEDMQIVGIVCNQKDSPNYGSMAVLGPMIPNNYRQVSTGLGDRSLWNGYAAIANAIGIKVDGPRNVDNNGWILATLFQDPDSVGSITLSDADIVKMASQVKVPSLEGLQATIDSGNNKILAAISQVDENTLATFGLKRA